MNRTRGYWKRIPDDPPLDRADQGDDAEELSDAAVLARLKAGAQGDDAVEKHSDVLDPARGTINGVVAGAILWALLLIAFTILRHLMST
jgi:hypothetical protein